ncbi:E3 ubiquitin-protein ligase RNF19B-like [Gouania willdenowi]|uniref:E3 ubiquitin-protein ligase RNF19B-like n=1 Tax=Gouania willdenowi TaxID=441366 RepID=A0A8C5GAJ6_GOUWI|nr:E3 ubiquitin-protein ligase RNF19B-like [Gouania willdenowi]
MEKVYQPNERRFVVVDGGPDDLDYTYECYSSRRARLSCGHHATPSSLTDWCSRQLKEGKSTFSCGTCGGALPYDEVRIKALLTPEEKEHFEKTLAFNATKSNPDAKICPGCNTSVARRQLSNLSVNCSVCTKRTGRVFEFCWQCLKEWKGSRPRADRCDNAGCCNEALKLLQTCSVVKFENVKDISNCPSIRACPTCGALLEHSGKKCKNITCARCNVEFCFVCLQLTSICLPTSNFHSPCAIPVAPKQTSIPQWNNTDTATLGVVKKTLKYNQSGRNADSCPSKAGRGNWWHGAHTWPSA